MISGSPRIVLFRDRLKTWLHFKIKVRKFPEADKFDSIEYGVMIKMPVTVNPEIRFVNVKKIVEKLSRDTRNVVLHLILLTKNVIYNLIRALVSHNYRGFYCFIDFGQDEKFRIRKFFPFPPIETLRTKILIDRQSPANTEYAVVNDFTIRDPKWMSTAVRGVIMIASDKSVISFCHRVVRWTRVRLGTRIVKSNAEIPDLN